MISKILFGSQDAEALYPSLKIRECARIVCQAIMNTKAEFEGIDYEEAVKYIAMTMTEDEIREEGNEHLIPKRKHKQGVRPGITSQEVFASKEALELGKSTFVKVTEISEDKGSFNSIHSEENEVPKEDDKMENSKIGGGLGIGVGRGETHLENIKEPKKRKIKPVFSKWVIPKKTTISNAY